MRIATLILLLFLYNNTNASHVIGGEITWKCSNGNYIFQLRIHRDCSKAQFPSSPQSILVAGHPVLTAITANFISSTDLSPDACFYDCTTNPSAGASVQEFVFRSDPVDLGNFVPPAGGWAFYWSLCCRNTTQNVLNSTSYEITLRSVMYSYDNRPASPCYNNSPAPAEKPFKLVCNTGNINFSETALELDHDSLHYAFDKPAAGTPPSIVLLNYAAPYSVTNPLPGVLNLNTTTGMVNWSLTNSNLGHYILCTRTDEFRCGTKIASIFHERVFSISSNCGTTSGGGVNSPPKFEINNIPIASYFDTVDVGDPVSFTFNVSDYDTNSTTVTPQVVSIQSVGSFGFNDTSTVGCQNGPCATLSISSGTTFQSSMNINFNWATDCNHLSSLSDCGNGYNLFPFLITAVDNSCPIPSYAEFYISIVVRSPYVTVSGNTLQCIGGISWQWYNGAVPIPGATNISYTPVSSGSYSVQVTTSGGCSFFTAPQLINVNCNFNPTVTGTLMLCPNDTGSITTQVYGTYQWYKRPIGGSAQAISGATSQSLSINYFDDAGYYFSVEATDSGCTEMSPEVLVDGWVFLLPSVSSTGDFTIGTNGETIVCDGDTMYFTLLPPYDTNIIWYESGNPIPGDTSTVLTVTDAGFYTVQGAPSTCPNFIQNLGLTLEVQVITCGVGVDEIADDGISIINPVTDYLKIISGIRTEDFILELVDINGRIVFKSNGTFGINTEFPLPDLESGMYTCILKAENDLLLTKRVVVKSQ